MIDKSKVIKNVTFNRALPKQPSPEIMTIEFEDGRIEEIKTSFIVPDTDLSSVAISYGLIANLLEQHKRIVELETTVETILARISVI